MDMTIFLDIIRIEKLGELFENAHKTLNATEICKMKIHP